MSVFFFFNDTATTEIYTLSLHDALPIYLSAVLRQLEDALERAGAAQLWVAPSCSLSHVPIDLDLETRLDSELKAWLAFAKQKLVEVATLARALRGGRGSVTAQLDGNTRALRGRRTS